MINKKIQYNKGEMSVGMLFLLIIVGLFVIWVLTGGPERQEEQKPFMKPMTDTEDPGGTYGLGEE